MLCVELTGVSLDIVHLGLWETSANRARNSDGKSTFNVLDTCALVPCARKNRRATLPQMSENVSDMTRLQAGIVNNYYI